MGRAIRAAAFALSLLAAFLGSEHGASAEERQEVDLQLILMVDVSGSINHDEYTLQRTGYVRAFRNPRVVNAIRSGPLGKIAIAYVEWTGPSLQQAVVDWTVLSDANSVQAFADQLEKKPRFLFSGGTAVGHAILHGAQSIEANRFTSRRRVIDISGDGATNRGIPAAMARDRVVAQGITINGLPILTDDPGLDEYYRGNVIGGPGSFVIPAKDFEDFSSSILAKLVREIASAAASDAASD